ncbi:unnamed protein product [Cylicostephanus goldi]|uniref:Uncharacterized protein n=1 Tax=Cylicostephanus goldi TaxID=71465 RepID=A0A3P6RRE9_CYLGO|nr:unnamed protein product [Cylicostephanus goldi]
MVCVAVVARVVDVPVIRTGGNVLLVVVSAAGTGTPPLAEGVVSVSVVTSPPPGEGTTVVLVIDTSLLG